MLRSLHILDRETAPVKETVVEMGICRGLGCSRSYTHQPPFWDIGMISGLGRWTTLVRLPSKYLEFSAEIARRLSAFAILVSVDEPVSWGFDAFDVDYSLGSYFLAVPEDTAQRSRNRLIELEKMKLKELGVRGLDKLGSRISSKDRSAGGFDPHLEKHYRSKLSSGELELPQPEFDPELPRKIHKITGLSTIARIRKILSRPHPEIGGSAGAFSMALNLPEWMDSATKNKRKCSGSDPVDCSICLFEKKMKV